MLSVVLNELLPEGKFPGIEVILGLVTFGIPLTIAVCPSGTQFFEGVVKESSHLVVKLVGAVAEAENHEVDTLKDRRIALILLGITEPFMCFLGVVAGISLVVSGHHKYN